MTTPIFVYGSPQESFSYLTRCHFEKRSRTSNEERVALRTNAASSSDPAFLCTASFHQVIGDLFGMSNYAVCKVISKAVHFISSRFPWDEEKLLRQSRIPLWLHTCQIYMNWVGSSIAVDDPTHRMSGREVKKGSKLYCRKSNCLGTLQTSRRIVTIRSGRDDPSVEVDPTIGSVRSWEKDKNFMNTGGYGAQKCCMLRSQR